MLRESPNFEGLEVGGLRADRTVQAGRRSGVHCNFASPGRLFSPAVFSLPPGWRTAMAATEFCQNCGRAIGKLETPRVHEQHVVCAECWGRLSPQPDHEEPRPVGDLSYLA